LWPSACKKMWLIIMENHLYYHDKGKLITLQYYKH
jgi:hypothetical protein